MKQGIAMMAAIWMLLGSGLPAQAGMCGFEHCWGALAIGPNGASGRASSMRTAPDAKAWAESACGGKCDRVEMFLNTCAALAGDRQGQAVKGTGDTRTLAEAAALDRCQPASGTCRVLVSSCSK